MDEIRISQPDHLDLTLFEVHGIAYGRAITRAARKAFEKNPTRFAIWDFTQASLSDLDKENLSNINRVAEYYAAKRHDPVTIFVCDKDMAKILLQYYILSSEHAKVPVKHEIVDSLESAYETIDRYSTRH